MKTTQYNATSRRRSGFPALCLLSACLAVATASAKIVDIEERSLPLDAATRLVAGLNDGNIRVTSQPGDSIKLIIKRTVYKLSEEDTVKVLKQIETDFDSRGDHILLKEKVPMSNQAWEDATGIRRVQYDLAYEVQVPPSIDLEIGTIDGNVAIEAVDGNCDLSSVDGDIFLANAGGTIKAQTVDGDIMIEQAAGTVDARSVDGDINVAGRDRIQAQTVDGDIRATFQAQPSGDNALHTVDGDIGVRVVPSAGVSFQAHTMDGAIKCDLSLEGPQITKRSLKGSLNGGGEQINLRTMDGEITIVGL